MKSRSAFGFVSSRSLSVMVVGCAVLVAIACLISSAPTRAAGPTFLYWSDPHVRTGSVASCFAFAKQTMTWKHAQNMRVIPIEVSGTIGGTYAAITCIGTAPDATAVVMVVGTAQNETVQVRDELANHIKGIVRFD